MARRAGRRRPRPVPRAGRPEPWTRVPAGAGPGRERSQPGHDRARSAGAVVGDVAADRGVVQDQGVDAEDAAAEGGRVPGHSRVVEGGLALAEQPAPATPGQVADEPAVVQGLGPVVVDAAAVAGRPVAGDRGAVDGQPGQAHGDPLVHEQHPGRAGPVEHGRGLTVGVAEDAQVLVDREAAAAAAEHVQAVARVGGGDRPGQGGPGRGREPGVLGRVLDPAGRRGRPRRRGEPGDHRDRERDRAQHDDRAPWWYRSGHAVLLLVPPPGTPAGGWFACDASSPRLPCPPADAVPGYVIARSPASQATAERAARAVSLFSPFGAEHADPLVFRGPISRGAVMRRVRILVVDDHQMLREALVGMLELSGFEVVGAVGDGADATSLAADLEPDVVLMDLSLPVMNGLDATRLLREVAPSAAIVVFSAFESPDLKRQAFAAGAVAYLPKGCGAERLRATVEAAVTMAGSNFCQA